MIQQQQKSISSSLHDPSPGISAAQRTFDPILPNTRASNSATYIPTKVYESYRQQQQNTSQLSKGSKKSILNIDEINVYEKASQLSQRLKNIHHFYKLRIDEQRSKNAERNEVFMSIVEELQKAHNDKIAHIKRQIESTQQQKKQVNYVDDKMSQIKGSIDEILKQSAAYKSSNEKLQQEIIQKEEVIRDKERQVERLKREEKEFRDQLEEFMKMNMKENRKQREMLEMIDNVLGVRGR